MKYLLLDTNVYIDLMISRRRDLKDSHFTLIKNLIDSGEVKIIMPDIVKHELERNVKLEILKIKEAISGAKKAVDAINWPYLSHDYKKFSESQNEIVKSLNLFKDSALSEENNHITKLLEEFQEIFDHSNVKAVSETSDMLENIRRKEIYKICPFHIADKDSYGDALIIEILLKSKEILNLDDDDLIYFITRNFKDFSSKVDKKVIHEDIEAEIQRLGLGPQIKYGINFIETLLGELNTEINNAKIYQDLLEVQRLTNIKQIEEYYENQKETLREMAGVKPLMDPHSYYEEVNQESSVDSFFTLVDDTSDKYINKLEDVLSEIEEFNEEIANTDSRVLLRNIRNYNENSPFLVINSENIGGVKLFFESNFITEEAIHKSIDSLYKELTISENKIFYLVGHNNKTYELKIINDLYVEEDGIDEIYINFVKDEKTLESATITLYYGYAEGNEDGTLGDAQDFSFEAVNVEKVIEVFEIEMNQNIQELEEVSDKISMLREILTKI